MCRGKVQVYYASQLAFYSSSLIMLFSWEERRKDFLEMLVHHIVTVVLITVSHITGYAAASPFNHSASFFLGADWLL